MFSVIKAFCRGFAAGIGTIVGFFGIIKWREYADSKEHPNWSDKNPDWENIETD